MPTSHPPSTSRRTIVKGAAWAAPTLAVGTMAPALAASLRKDPGINGWVLNDPTSLGWCRYRLDVNSNPSNGGTTSDGAPFGLYLYDVLPNAVITNAKLVYWIIGDQNASWTNKSGHSGCWRYDGRGDLQNKADGLAYRPYTWTYTCPILPGNVSTDGRLRLGNFHVEASFTQQDERGNRYCNDVTYWTQRSITIDQYGDGHPAVLTFERRNGTRGPFAGTQRRAQADGDAGAAGAISPAAS